MIANSSITSSYCLCNGTARVTAEIGIATKSGNLTTSTFCLTKGYSQALPSDWIDLGPASKYLATPTSSSGNFQAPSKDTGSNIGLTSSKGSVAGFPVAHSGTQSFGADTQPTSSRAHISSSGSVHGPGAALPIAHSGTQSPSTGVQTTNVELGSSTSSSVRGPNAAFSVVHSGTQSSSTGAQVTGSGPRNSSSSSASGGAGRLPGDVAGGVINSLSGSNTQMTTSGTGAKATTSSGLRISASSSTNTTSGGLPAVPAVVGGSINPSSRSSKEETSGKSAGSIVSIGQSSGSEKSSATGAAVKTTGNVQSALTDTKATQSAGGITQSTAGKPYLTTVDGVALPIITQSIAPSDVSTVDGATSAQVSSTKNSDGHAIIGGIIAGAVACLIFCHKGSGGGGIGFHVPTPGVYHNFPIPSVPGFPIPTTLPDLVVPPVGGGLPKFVLPTPSPPTPQTNPDTPEEPKNDPDEKKSASTNSASSTKSSSSSCSETQITSFAVSCAASTVSGSSTISGSCSTSTKTISASCGASNTASTTTASALACPMLGGMLSLDGPGGFPSFYATWLGDSTNLPTATATATGSGGNAPGLGFGFENNATKSTDTSFKTSVTAASKTSTAYKSSALKSPTISNSGGTSGAIGGAASGLSSVERPTSVVPPTTTSKSSTASSLAPTATDIPADRAVDCHTEYALLETTFRIKGRHFDQDTLGEWGLGLLKQLRGCANVRNWVFNKDDKRPIGWEWWASGQVELIGQKGCIGRAIVSAGGPSDAKCAGS